jgi:light-regulated signal transduction histidine kinase (bacteriophytochrome)
MPSRRATRKSADALESEVANLSARVDELEREKAALEAFAAIAAHELVEPLVIAEAYASMVTDRLDADAHADSRRDLAALSRAASRTRLLLEALLHDARAAEHQRAHGPVDLGAVVAECVDLLRPEVDERGASFHVGKLPTVEGDESLLYGLFANLLMNALKYSPRHGAEIRVDAAREGQLWHVSVESEGATIPPEDRWRIFDAFQRGRGERRERGAGLGLAICRRIVERHGGYIGVTPGAAGGNRFFFTLPA